MLRVLAFFVLFLFYLNLCHHPHFFLFFSSTSSVAETGLSKDGTFFHTFGHSRSRTPRYTNNSMIVLLSYYIVIIIITSSSSSSHNYHDTHGFLVNICCIVGRVCVRCACVRVCVRERDRQTDRQRQRHGERENLQERILLAHNSVTL